MKRTLLSAFIILAAVALVGCGGGTPAAAPTGFAPNQTAEAYAYVHGGYVGQAVATTNADGALSVQIDEAFLPHTLAIVDINAPEWNENNTVYYVSRGNQIRVAKWVAFRDARYTGVTVGSGLSYVSSDSDGSPSGGTDLAMFIIRNEANMGAWFSGVQNGEFRVFTEFGGTPIPVTTTSYGKVTKRGSTYWTQGIGWAGNMEAIGAAAVEHGVAFGLNEMTRRSDDNRWQLADAVTAATASDFKDYFALIQLATARLKLQ